MPNDKEFHFRALEKRMARCSHNVRQNVQSTGPQNSAAGPASGDLQVFIHIKPDGSTLEIDDGAQPLRRCAAQRLNEPESVCYVSSESNATERFGRVPNCQCPDFALPFVPDRAGLISAPRMLCSASARGLSNCSNACASPAAAYGANKGRKTCLRASSRE